tara:strand:+ start:2250 stop:2702 length:453 start_codon:yes stop_codon:yes gene_type:complete
MATLNKKILISLNSAFLFVLVNHPKLLSLGPRTVGKVEKKFGITGNSLGPTNLNSVVCPTNIGLLLNALVFFSISYFSMGKAKINNGIKIKHALYGTLIFYLVSSPALYSVVGSIFGEAFSSKSGCPTLYGVLLHALVYFCLLVGVMYLP